MTPCWGYNRRVIAELRPLKLGDNDPLVCRYRRRVGTQGLRDGPQPAEQECSYYEGSDVHLGSGSLPARSKHRAGADAPDHLAVAGRHWRSRRCRSMADTIHYCANAISGTDHGLSAIWERRSSGGVPRPQPRDLFVLRPHSKMVNRVPVRLTLDLRAIPRASGLAAENNHRSL